MDSALHEAAHVEVTKEAKAIEVSYEFHPAADLFPLMETESAAFGELVQDIRENGLLDSIELFEGKILDGRNRYRACRHAGVEPRFVTYEGTEPYHHVWSRHLRRELAPDQRAAIAIEFEPFIAAEVEKRRRATQATTRAIRKRLVQQAEDEADLIEAETEVVEADSPQQGSNATRAAWSSRSRRS
jgi:hypothetical protein